MKKGKEKRDFLPKAIGEKMLWSRMPVINGSSSFIHCVQHLNGVQFFFKRKSSY